MLVGRSFCGVGCGIATTSVVVVVVVLPIIGVVTIMDRMLFASMDLIFPYKLSNLSSLKCIFLSKVYILGVVRKNEMRK
jgi:hypothetical protein